MGGGFLQTKNYVVSVDCVIATRPITRFLPRDAMRKLAVGRCPSVRPTRSCIVSQRLKISSNFFLGLTAPSFLLLEAFQRYQIPRETQSMGALITRGLEKFAIFEGNRRFSRKQYKYANGCYGMLMEIHREPIDSCQCRWPWV